MNKVRYKRKNYFIKKKFQGKLILGYFLFMVIGCLMFAGALTVLSADSMTIVYKDNDLQIGMTSFMLLKKLLAAHWVTIAMGSFVVVGVAMVITHRVAGPMFRLERTLDNMIMGELDDVIFLRKKDEGKELAAKLNQFNQELSENIGLIRKRSQNIEDLLAQYGAIDPNHSPVEDSTSIQSSIARQNHAIREIVKIYQLLDE